jgi:hypothetical protein
VSQGPQHNQYMTGGALALGALPVSSVAFPAQKVHMHDAAAWHFGRGSHFAFPEMRLPLLFADGSVQVRASGDSNPGWQPNTPASAQPTVYSYAPGLTGGWEPPTPNGLQAQQVTAGRYRWTRGTPTELGIAGRDSDGPETCSGQPGCP